APKASCAWRPCAGPAPTSGPCRPSRRACCRKGLLPQAGGSFMAGHSQWANRKHRKARQDAKKGKIFSKMAREITMAARMGGGDPDINPRLRAALEKARQFGVPNENIERAIKRGTGELEGAAYEELMYEGYGPGE